MEVTSVDIRGDRRLRLTFTEAVGTGAFTSVSYYTVTSTDGVGASPPVKAALMVAGNPSNVELVLSYDLISGGSYTVAAIGVPALAGSPSTIVSTLFVRNGRSPQRTNLEPLATDAGSFFYGRDLFHDGTDFVETAGGDLATVTGTQNVAQALQRRVGAIFLPYDPTYGLDVRDYVDAPSPTGTSLKGKIIQQMRADSRVASVSVVLTQTNEQSYFTVSPTLVGDETVQPITVNPTT